MLFLPGQCLSCRLTYYLMQARTVSFWCKSRTKYKLLDSKLENKLKEMSAWTVSSSNTFLSMNSVILRFPKFRQEFRDIRALFEELGKDCDGRVRREDVERCLTSLDGNLKKDEVEDLLESDNIVDGSHCIKFNDFIALLSLAYVLTAQPSTTSDTKLSKKVTSCVRPEVETMLGKVVEVFLYLDKNGDGKLQKKDLSMALNGAYPWERSPRHVIKNRFSTYPTCCALSYYDFFSNLALSLRSLSFVNLRLVFFPF
uniref:EF-hand domain-containing protein n=1 Tax=Kalanchoe fedtschenkoi TaxID=63787 RepID=A0A7N0UH53_KALFE